jgi:hypothetical protein
MLVAFKGAITRVKAVADSQACHAPHRGCEVADRQVLRLSERGRKEDSKRESSRNESNAETGSKVLLFGQVSRVQFMYLVAYSSGIRSNGK